MIKNVLFKSKNEIKEGDIVIHLVFTDENEDIKGEWVEAEIKPEPEGELSTDFYL